jgi:hypothetical protein
MIRHMTAATPQEPRPVAAVWESLEAFERFGDVLDEIASQVPGAVHVKLHRVHNVI